MTLKYDTGLMPDAFSDTSLGFERAETMQHIKLKILSMVIA